GRDSIVTADCKPLILLILVSGNRPRQVCGGQILVTHSLFTANRGSSRSRLLHTHHPFEGCREGSIRKWGDRERSGRRTHPSSLWFVKSFYKPASHLAPFQVNLWKTLQLESVTRNPSECEPVSA